MDNIEVGFFLGIPTPLAKPERILDLYARIWQGKPLHRSEFVISADEKTSVQARRRKQPSLPTGAGRPTRVEHEYFPQGAWTYLAAWEVHHAKLFGHGEKKTGIAPTDRLIAARKQWNAFDPAGSTRFLYTLPFMPAGSTKLKSISPSFKESYSPPMIFPPSPPGSNAIWIFKTAMNKLPLHYNGLTLGKTFTLCSQSCNPERLRREKIRHRNSVL